MGGIWDFISGIGKGGTEAFGNSFWPAAIMAGTSLVSNLWRDPTEGMAFGNTEAGFQQNLAAEKEMQAAQIAAQKEIAAMQAASAGKGAGAQIAAANIARDAALRQMVMKNAADALAFKLDMKKSGIAALQKARENILAGKLKEAELMSALYQNAGASLMAMRK